MANGRKSMRNIFEFFRIHWGLGLSQEKAAQGSGVSKGLGWYLAKKAKALGLVSWEHIKVLSPEEFEDLIYGRSAPVTLKIQPDWNKILTSLRVKHVTRELLWQEYREEFGAVDTMKFCQFCACISRHMKMSDLAMRQTHIPGDKGFFDFAGSTITINPLDGAAFQAHLFVAALRASSPAVPGVF